ncbi:MAG: GGDEF domain-containing protein [Pseudomonadota bacterium]
MAVPEAISFKHALAAAGALLSKLKGNPAPNDIGVRENSGLTTRSENTVISLLLAATSIPLFGCVYYWFGDAQAARLCVISLVGVAAAAAALRYLRRVALARETLVVTIFVLLLALIFQVGGARSPSVIWLTVCPMLATAGGGARIGLRWTLAIIAAMIAVYAADVAGLYPAPLIADLRTLNLVGHVGFVMLVALFLVLYERNNAAAIGRLNAALATIQTMAVRDELTGIYNRRELLRVAQQEKMRANRHDTPLSFCLIDVDHFKQVNDNWGHQAGDEVLRAIAGSIAQLMRATDCFGRYGGEEFVMILGDTARPGALEFAERVRAAIAALAFPAIGDARVTISIGVAQALAAESVAQALARADVALYRAKREGRNRVLADQ